MTAWCAMQFIEILRCTLHLLQDAFRVAEHALSGGRGRYAAAIAFKQRVAQFNF
jgi:hypothetical protein